MPNQNRTVSLEEDEGFCDSDDADKKLVLSPPEANKNQKQDYESKKKKKKAQLNKKVSFKTDIDEIPGSLQSSNSNELPMLASNMVQRDSDPLRHDTSFNPTRKKNSDKMADASVNKTANKSNPSKKKKKSSK